MKRFPIAVQALSDLRWLIFWFGCGLALYGAGMVLLFPFFEDYLEEVAATYPEEILQFFGQGDLTTPQGFITLEYQSFAVLALMIYALVAATGQLAGDESRGTLEGLLSQPVTRQRLMVERALAVLGGGFLICSLICLGWLVSVPFVDFHGELTLLELIGATFGALPSLMVFGSLGFLVGAIAPSRGAAAGILAAFAVVSYLASSLAGAVEPIEWMRFLSLYHYSDGSRWLTEGPSVLHQAGLAVGSVAIFLLALHAFDRREIGARRWQVGVLVPERARGR